MINTYKVYFTDGTGITLQAVNEDEARWKAEAERMGCIISHIYLTR